VFDAGVKGIALIKMTRRERTKAIIAGEKQDRCGEGNIQQVSGDVA
jgi:hypothetical protein